MAWPTNSIDTTPLDADTDSPALARPELKKLADNMNLMRASRGNPDGVPSLDLTGLIPTTQLPVVPATKGGSGQSTYAIGDILYASAYNMLSKLSAGASGYALVSNGPNLPPSWQLIKPSIINQSVNADVSIVQADLSKNFYHAGGTYTYNLPNASSVTDGFYFYVTFYDGIINFAATSGQSIFPLGNSANWGVNTLAYPDVAGDWVNINSFLVMKMNATSFMIIPIGRATGSKVITASSSWTCPAGVTTVTASGIGGGGASGVDGGCAPGRGGNGAAAFKKKLAVVPGTAYAVVIGAGGTTTGGGVTSFGSLLTLNGGAVGGNSGSSTSGTAGADGTPNYRFDTSTSTNLGSDFTAGYGSGGSSSGTANGARNVGVQGILILEW